MPRRVVKETRTDSVESLGAFEANPAHDCTTGEEGKPQPTQQGDREKDMQQHKQTPVASTAESKVDSSSTPTTEEGKTVEAAGTAEARTAAKKAAANKKKKDKKKAKAAAAAKIATAAGAGEQTAVRAASIKGGDKTAVEATTVKAVKPPVQPPAKPGKVGGAKTTALPQGTAAAAVVAARPKSSPRQTSSAVTAFTTNANIRRFHGVTLSEDAIVGALHGLGLDVRRGEHKAGTRQSHGRWEWGNARFEVHLGYDNNGGPPDPLVDTIVQGKKGWKKHTDLLDAVANALLRTVGAIQGQQGQEGENKGPGAAKKRGGGGGAKAKVDQNGKRAGASKAKAPVANAGKAGKAPPAKAPKQAA
jgi:hypothetical protein